MRRSRNAHRRSRSRRVQRIGQQVVIPEILVPAKQHSKVIPLVLVDAQAGHVVRIAAVAEVAEAEIVEQEAVVVHRAHIQRVIEETNARTKIHEGIVGVDVPVDRRWSGSRPRWTAGCCSLPNPCPWFLLGRFAPAIHATTPGASRRESTNMSPRAGVIVLSAIGRLRSCISFMDDLYLNKVWSKLEP